MKRLIVSLVICVIAALSTAACTSSTCPQGTAFVSNFDLGWMIGLQEMRASRFLADAKTPIVRDQAYAALRLIQQVRDDKRNGAPFESIKFARAVQMLDDVGQQFLAEK